MDRASKLWLVALVGAVNLAAGCQDAAGGEDDPTEAYCPEGGGDVTLVNGSGRAIRELQVRGLEDGDLYSLVGAGSGLAIDGEITWRRCPTGPQALIVTFTDGAVEVSELPSLAPSTRRLTLKPDGKPVLPPPAPRPPGRELPDDVTGGNSVPTMGR